MTKAPSPTREEARRTPINWPRLLGALEWVVGGLILLVSGTLHWQQRGTAGALWRDEATSIQVATLPTWSELWRYLEFDSYPILYHVVLRGWNGMFGNGDTSLRTLGFLVGMGLLGAFWAAARVVGVRVPLLAWALLGLNALMIRFGDSTRAYGLGCALAVLSAAATWRAGQTDRIRWPRIALAAVAGVVSVQCLYHNATLLLASALGVAVVALSQRRIAVAAAVLASGLPAALSLLPYLPTIRRTGDWSILFRHPATVSQLWERVSEVLDCPLPGGHFLWTALVLAGVGLALWRVASRDRTPGAADPQTRTQAAAALTLAIGLASYLGFLFLLEYPTKPWYYLAILAVVALCLDVILGQNREGTARFLRLGLAAVLALVAPSLAGNFLPIRSTNMDLVARQLNAHAQANDLVVAVQWEQAISLNRYYHGPATMESVPRLNDHKVHRFDLILEAYRTPLPLQPVFDAMEQTLRAGGKVWLVGRAPVPSPERREKLIALSKPDAQGKWPRPSSYGDWYELTGQFLFDHCRSCSLVPVFPQGKVSTYERVQLAVLAGWQDAAQVDQAAPAPTLGVP